MEGWIKLHRTVTDSFVFQNPDRLKFWIWCLCKASHKERNQTVGLQTIILKPGQFIFGRKKASIELNMDESKIYRLIKTFEKREKIEVQSNNKYSVVSVVNWNFYQTTEQQTEQQSNNKLTTNEQQSNTNKNVKNVKNKKSSGYTDDFEELYLLYPRSANKKRTFTNYKKQLKEFTHSELLLSVKNYKTKCELDKTEETYIKISSNFFGEDETFRDYLKKKEETIEERLRRKAEEREYATG